MEKTEDKKQNRLFTHIEKPEDIVLAAKQRIANYFSELRNTGHYQLFINTNQRYYRGLITYGKAEKIIDKESNVTLDKLSVNHFQNLVKHMLVLITKKRPTIRVFASQGSKESTSAAEASREILLHYLDRTDKNETLKIAKLYELLYGSSYVFVHWDKFAGERTKTDDGSAVDGDMSITSHSPLNVITDIHVKNPHYHIIRETVSLEWARHHYGVGAPSEKFLCSDFQNFDFTFLGNSSTNDSGEEHADIYYIVCEPDSKMPNGRFIILLGNSVIYDSAKKYKDALAKHEENEANEANDTSSHEGFGDKPDKVVSSAPSPNQYNCGAKVVRCINDKIEGKYFGNSVAWELMNMQNAIDSMISTEISNYSHYGMAMLVVQKDTNLDLDAIQKLPVAHVENMDSDAPRTLNLYNHNPASIALSDYFTKSMEKTSGISSVLRGEGKASQSGAALNLLSQASLSFSSGPYESYVKMYQEVSTAVLFALKCNLTSDRVIHIIGDNDQLRQHTFNAKDLGDDTLVEVKPINWILATDEGRHLFAQQLRETQQITGKQYAEFVATGRIEAIIGDGLELNSAMQSQRHALKQGKVFSPIPFQNHPAFISDAVAFINGLVLSNDKTEPSSEIKLIIDATIETLKIRDKQWQQDSIDFPNVLTSAGIPLHEQVVQNALMQAQGAPPGAPQGSQPPPAPQPQ